MSWVIWFYSIFLNGEIFVLHSGGMVVIEDLAPGALLDDSSVRRLVPRKMCGVDILQERRYLCTL